jgi:hypothetical protein
MLIRANKYDEFTLPDQISKINMTHALARLSASVSRRIICRICPRMEEDRTCPFTPNHAMHTLRTSSALAQFYRCVRHRKAATDGNDLQRCILFIFYCFLTL